MALDRSAFKTRSLSAAIFVVVMLAGLLVNHWTFFLLFTIIHFGCWVEYQRIIARIHPEYRTISVFHRYGVMVAGWCFMLYFTSNDFHFGDFLLHPVGFWLALLFAFLLPVTEILLTNNISLKNIGYSFFGIIYISLSLGLLTDLLLLPAISFHSTPVLPIVIIACMWINDTMAYISGSLFGKTPLSPVSPKKTWEGTIGGIILCVIAVAALGSTVPILQDIYFIHWLVIALIAAVTGTFGDLLESKLKRMAGIKDSGSIMPGHGGFLDRFDSLLVAIPFVWLYVEFVLR